MDGSVYEREPTDFTGGTSSCSGCATRASTSSSQKLERLQLAGASVKQAVKALGKLKDPQQAAWAKPLTAQIKESARAVAEDRARFWWG